MTGVVVVVGSVVVVVIGVVVVVVVVVGVPVRIHVTYHAAHLTACYSSTLTDLQNERYNKNPTSTCCILVFFPQAADTRSFIILGIKRLRNWFPCTVYTYSSAVKV